MTNQTALLVGAAVTIAGSLHHWWRHARARDAAHEWLRGHHYRVRDLSVPWFSGMIFGPSLFRNSDNAFDFRAVVDDRELGGTGTVRLRVWMNRMGVIDREIEVLWEQMPDENSEESGSFPAPPLAERLMGAQLDLLRRIAEGETFFSLPRSGQYDGAVFDQLVEHVLALSRRGLITCGEPESGARRGTQYSHVSQVALTVDGRAYLAENELRTAD